MKQYKDLNLKEIRDKLDIDFARYTYSRGQCSCCYGPKDMPKRYWKDGIIKTKDYTYILFKNACNDRGIVSKNDWIAGNTYIKHKLTDSQKEQCCQMLREQLDSDYMVLEPVTNMSCIIILCKSNGLFRLNLSDITDYKTKFNQSEINKAIVKANYYVYFDNDFNIVRFE